MANSLRAKLSKLRHDGNITDTEYQALIKKLDGHDTEIRAKAIDEFAERIKERLKGLQMVELQGGDKCPCSETGEPCPYINQDISCQYCAREHTIKDIEEIAEEMIGAS